MWSQQKPQTVQAQHVLQELHHLLCDGCRETVKYFTNEQLEEDKYSEAIDGYQVRSARTRSKSSFLRFTRSQALLGLLALRPVSRCTA